MTNTLAQAMAYRIATSSNWESYLLVERVKFDIGFSDLPIRVGSSCQLVYDRQTKTETERRTSSKRTKVG